MFEFSFANANIGDYFLLFFKFYFFILGIFAVSYSIFLLCKFIYRIIKKPKIKSIIMILLLILLGIFPITRNIIIILSFSILVFYNANFIFMCFSAVLLKIKEKNKNTKKFSDKNPMVSFPDNYNYPTLSILFPIKDESKIICNSLDKVLEVDYPIDKIDIVVIDDHSTDNTLEVLNNYSKKDMITILENDQELGKASAMNKALKHIKTDFVLILDADHYMSKDFLKNGIRFFDDCDVVMVQGGLTIRNGKRSLISKLVEIEYNHWHQIFYYTRSTTLFMGSGCIFRSNALKATGEFNNDIPTEDWEMSYRIHQKGYKTVYCNKFSTNELAPEKIKDFMKQRYRWIRGTWTGLKVQFSNILNNTKMDKSKKIEILSLGLLPIILIGYFVIYFFYSLGFINIIAFPIDFKIILLCHIPFYIYNILGLIFAKNLKNLPFIIFIPFEYLMYSLSGIEAMIDEWIFNSSFKGLKADRSGLEMID